MKRHEYRMRYIMRYEHVDRAHSFQARTRREWFAKLECRHTVALNRAPRPGRKKMHCQQCKENR